MIRILSKFTCSTIVAVAFSASAFAACPSTVLIKQVALSADGTVTRSIYVKKDNGGFAHTHFVVAPRDTVKLEKGDSIILNTSPTAVDALFTVEVSLQDQERDDQGVISSTFHVVENQTSQFAGAGGARTIKSAYLVKIPTNSGDSRAACNQIVKTTLDLESSSDVHGTAPNAPAVGGI